MKYYLIQSVIRLLPRARQAEGAEGTIATRGKPARCRVALAERRSHVDPSPENQDEGRAQIIKNFNYELIFKII